MKGYIQRHIAMRKYHQTSDTCSVYRNQSGWQDFLVGDSIVFSHRTNDYCEKNFPEHLHSHDYCELIFWERGEVGYLCGDRSITPREGCVVMIPSKKSHTAKLRKPSVYERFVLYFTPAAFDFFGKSAQLIQDVFFGNDTFFFHLRNQSRDEITKQLRRIEAILEKEDKDAQLLAYAEITLLLHRLQEEISSSKENTDPTEEALPQHIRDLRNFLDKNYVSVESVEEVAAHFYYSREYATRIFTKYFNLSPWKYVEQLRIRDACQRIDDREKITEICYAVGYRSMSAFSAAFRRVMGVSPTEYRKKK